MATSRTVMLRVLVKILLIFCIKGPLFNTNSVCYSFINVEEIERLDVQPKLVYDSLFILQQKKSLFLQARISMHLLLLLSGDIETCPGPTFAEFTDMRGMKIIHQNIRGLLHNFAEFNVVLEKYKNIDIITLSETHTTQQDEESIFSIPGFTFVSKPRVNGPGGGVAAYISNDLTWRRREDLESDNLEILCIEIIAKNAKNFIVCTAYRPPESSNYLVENFNDLFETFLTSVNEVFNEIIILGDLNANYLKKDCSKEFKTILSRHNYQQMIDTPTRITKDTSTLIDVILTNFSKNVAAVITVPLSLSDHDMIGCVRKLNNIKTKPRTIKCRNYSSYNPENLKRELTENLFEPLYQMNDVNNAWLFLRDVLTHSFNRHAPTITKRVKGSFAPWLNSDLKQLMNNRDKLLRKFRKTHADNYWDEYKRLRNRCTTEIRYAKARYHQNLLTENRHNPKKFWQTIKSIFPGKKTSNSVSGKSDLGKANSYCQFFSTVAQTLKLKTFLFRQFVWQAPTTIKKKTLSTFQFGYVTTMSVERELKRLKRHKSTGIDNLPPGMLKDVAHQIAKPISHIINLSLRNGQIPFELKISQVIPLHKKGSINDPNNFRPISVLPVISKILEKAVHKQLIEYLEHNNLLSVNQYGYRSKRSTELATTLLTDTIRKEADHGMLTGAVFLDLSKAFDTLGHGRLLEKLKSYGIKGLSHQWFTDYLFMRYQVVKLGQELSDPCPLVCGVPQGSILGPILFLLFFNDFEDDLSCRTIQFADDTVIFTSSKSVFQIESILNKDLTTIASYLKDNDLIINLNKGKTESMLFGTSKRIANVPPESRNLKLFCDEVLINSTTSYTYLGTVLDQHLNLNTDFDSKYNRASKKLGVLKKLMDFLTLDAARLLYTAVIVSALKYNSSVHLKITHTQHEKLNSIERRANIILRTKTTPIFNVFQKQAVLFVKKCLDKNSVPIFNDYFLIRQHTANTRNNNISINLPKVKLELAKGSFYFMGAKFYNLLPKNVRESGPAFKEQVKMFFK